MMKRFGLSIVAIAFLASTAWAQCPKVTCPANVTVDNDPGKCGAVVNYTVISQDSCGSGTQTFSYTGSVQFWVVPTGVNLVNIQAEGAQGASNNAGILGGMGGDASGDLVVTPGDTLWIYVGGQNGFNGGGNNGVTPCTQALGGNGGGASDVRAGGQNLSNRVIVAAGGGGAGGNRLGGCGRGSGGGGGGGYYGGGGGAGWPQNGVLPSGGSQSAGGSAGTSTYTTTCSPNNSGTAGALGVGGDGGCEVSSNQAGSGTALVGAVGGGLTGATGTYAGNYMGQSGAGGSSYIGGVNNGVTNSGTRSGNGQIVLTYTGPTTLTQIAGMASGSMFPIGTTNNTFVVSGQSGPNDTCSFTITVNDTNAVPTLGALSQDTICTSSGTITLPAGSPAGGVYSGPGVTGNMFDPATAERGDHWIYYTDTSGCNHADSVMITVVWCTGIEEGEMLHNVQVLPNPSNGLFQVRVGEGVNATVSLSDVTGRIILKGASFRNTYNLDISNEKDGVYIMNVRVGEATRSIRLIKQ